MGAGAAGAGAARGRPPGAALSGAGRLGRPPEVSSRGSWQSGDGASWRRAAALPSAPPSRQSEQQEVVPRDSEEQVRLGLPAEGW